MAGLSINMISFLGLRQCFLAAAVVVCVLFCLTTTTTAMLMKNMVEEAVRRTRMEQQQQQQLEEHERQNRPASDNACARPDNVAAMFEQINSQLGSAQFLTNFNSSLGIAVGEDPNENKTCPSSLTSNSSAPLAHRSLCPYYIKAVVLPEGHYPASLPSAVCKCVECVEHNAYGCEAVQTRITVLKSVGCFQGLLRYEEQMYELNTGCVCATPGSAQSTTTSAPISTTSPSFVD